jgi:hypothetical protein
MARCLKSTDLGPDSLSAQVATQLQTVHGRSALHVQPTDDAERVKIETSTLHGRAKITAAALEHVQRLAPVLDWTITAMAREYGLKRSVLAPYFSGYGRHYGHKAVINPWNAYQASEEVADLKLECKPSPAYPLATDASECSRAGSHQRRTRRPPLDRHEGALRRADGRRQEDPGGRAARQEERAARRGSPCARCRWSPCRLGGRIHDHPQRGTPLD